MALPGWNEDMQRRLLRQTQPNQMGQFPTREQITGGGGVPSPINPPDNRTRQARPPAGTRPPGGGGQTDPNIITPPGGGRPPTGPIYQRPDYPHPPPPDTPGQPQDPNLPGGAFNPQMFNEMFQSAFTQAMDPYSQQLGSLQQQQQTILDQLGGLQQPTGGLTQDQLSAALQQNQQSLMDQLAGTMTPGGEQFNALQNQLTDLMGYFQGGEGSFQDILSQTMGQTGQAAQNPTLDLTDEQLQNLFGGTGDATQMPGFMYGPDYFRSMNDYMTELATANPSQDVLGAMGDVLASGPASYGQLGETLAQRLTSPTVFEGDLGQELLGQVRGLGEVNTDAYNQLLDTGMARLDQAEQRALDQEMMRLNRLGLTPEGQASGTVLDPLAQLRGQFQMGRNDLMANLTQQEAQRQDALRQAQVGAMGGVLGQMQAGRQAGTSGLSNLLGLQQAGQQGVAGGLGNLAQMLTGNQQAQLGALGNISSQAWGQNMQDIQMQNQLFQAEQARQNNLVNSLLGQTAPGGAQQPSLNFGGLGGGGTNVGSAIGSGLSGAAMGAMAGLGPWGIAAAGLGSLLGGLWE